jgi:tRNA dimethylallyltransferase
VKNTLIVILGPTASGKTSLSLGLAQKYNTEIISADSRQFYREIPIGTAAPDKSQLKMVRHHFVGNLSVLEHYNVSRFEKEALNLMEGLFPEKNPLIMVGGSGLYLNAVCEGMDEMPATDPKVRAELEELLDKEGISALQAKLKVLDPDHFAVVDPDNPKRLLRALEVCLQTGKPYSSFRRNRPQPREFSTLKIGLQVPREELANRIRKRTEEMLRKGWLEEAKAMLPYRHLNALNTVGYKELFSYFDGIMSLDQAVEKINTNTRRYAKRQMTWFRKDQEVEWFTPDRIEEIPGYLEKAMNS